MKLVCTVPLIQLSGSAESFFIHSSSFLTQLLDPPVNHSPNASVATLLASLLEFRNLGPHPRYCARGKHRDGYSLPRIEGEKWAARVKHEVAFLESAGRPDW